MGLNKRIDESSGRIVSWIKSFPVSLIVGFAIGGSFTWYLTGWNSILAGAILGIVLRMLYTYILRGLEMWKKTRPLLAILGPIADTEACYIFFSPFYCDMSEPNEFEPRGSVRPVRARKVRIQKSDSVIAEGDALSLALIQSLLARVPVPPSKIIVERAEQEPMKWGVNSFCIGAHNTKTRAILSKFHTKFYYFDNNFTVITTADSAITKCRMNGQPFRRGVYAKRWSKGGATDFGIVLKLRDEFRNNDAIIFVIAGIGPAGTSGAAYFLLTHFQELSKEGDQFGILVEVPGGYQSARRVDYDEVAEYYSPYSSE